MSIELKTLPSEATTVERVYLKTRSRAATPRERIRSDIIRLCHAGLDVRTLGLEVLRRLQHAVPFDASCWPTADPATSLITGAVSVGVSPKMAQGLLQLEYTVEDFNKFSDLARSVDRVAVLSEATGNALERSARYREVLGPNGLGDELRAALVTDGSPWAYLALMRERSSPFTPAEAAFVAQLTEHMAEGVRAALLVAGASGAGGLETDDGPGLLVLGNDLSVILMTPAAERWLDEMAEVDKSSQTNLPYAVSAVVSRLRALDSVAEAPAMPIPRARLRTRVGRWVVVRASHLQGTGAEGQMAVLLEEVRPHEMASLILAAYRLTERERQLTQFVARGLSTAEIAAELHITANTIQDHLKAIFDKVGVRSRRELVARIFAQQYQPRIAAGTRLGPDGWFV